VSNTTDALLDRTGSPADRDPRPAAWALGRPPRPAWIGLFVFSVAAVAWAAHAMFLFADDFIFLSQAREQSFDPHYLRRGLFQHFSPLTRVVNAVLAPLIPHWRAAPFAFLIVMQCCVVAGAILLMRALFGRTWVAWLGSLALGTSLSLVPTMHWWTAGLNILPAMAGVSAGFGAMVFYLRGRSAWWVALAVFGYLVAIGDYEIGMLLPCYLALWLLLFGRRVLGQPLLQVLRRSWWAWAGLAVLFVLAMLNYRIYYYEPAPKAPAGLLVRGLTVSFFQALVPGMLGLHGDGQAPGWNQLCITIGTVVLLGIFVLTMRRSLDAWRGWAFAVAGWLLPALALLVNRLGFGHDTTVAGNVIYQYFASMMFLVGVLEALSRAALVGRWRAISQPSPRRLRWGAATAALLCLLIGAGWVRSVDPAMRPQFIASSSRDYVSNVEQGAANAGRGGPYGLLDTTVPGGLIVHSFAPYDRASKVVGLYSPNLPFDVPAARMFIIDATGRLHPVRLRTLATITPGSASPGGTSNGQTGAMSADAVTDLHQDPQLGMCFSAGPQSRVSVTLPRQVSSDRLVIRTEFTVSAATTERYSVLNGKGWQRANDDRKLWRPGRHALLDTVSSTSARALQVNGFTAGAQVCISAISITRVIAPQ
jgi:hypothetical protein